ncbi:hypothetical protein GCM10023187_00910 [Nibrella viscosa]|uniref:Uncharacterized protein n=1 Tax=Nibrella viscosa TaxID=1084524 RepID=A0ABP8JRU9_9BACT
MLRIAAFFCLLCTLAHAQPVVLRDPDKAYPVTENSAALLVEPGQTITIDSLLCHPEKYNFVPVRQRPIRPNGKRDYWLKLELTNPSSENYLLHCYFFADSQ